MADASAAGVPAAASSSPGPAAMEELPRKRMHTQEDVCIFTESTLCQQLISFASELSQSIHGLEISQERTANASVLVQGLVEILSELESWLDDFPPLDQPMRFGNKAFRSWHARLVERAEGLLLEAFRKASLKEAEAIARELSVYLSASFGDETRIDYGTGHEASFFALCFILGARGVLAKSDAPDVVLVVFSAYMRVMARLQKVYVLEPAGSHGVWGLDDYHALPFLFGAAQLVGMEEDVPTSKVYQERVVQDYADRFLYVGAIQQVLSSKRGAPFHETSPMLYDITAVPTWQKTHNGLLKMYRAEVLGKFPVIQHFLFGPTMQWPGSAKTAAPAAAAAVVRSAVQGAVDAGVACVAPWAKAAGSAAGGYTQGAALPGVACVAPWAKASTAASGMVPTVAPWANKN